MIEVIIYRFYPRTLDERATWTSSPWRISLASEILKGPLLASFREEKAQYAAPEVPSIKG
jgi:hypothetical protein